MKHKISLYELFKIKSLFPLNVFNNYIYKKYFLIILMLFYFTSEQLEISLVIKGIGEKNFLNEEFYLNPDKVIVNGNIKENCHKSCNFEEDLNNVTIRFNEQINSCENMFKDMRDIIEIDLSNLDTSKVTSMHFMFNGCSNLKKWLLEI